MKLGRIGALMVLCGVLISCAAGGEKHPGRTIGIEEFPEARDLFEFAERYRSQYELPALGVGIVRGGRIIGLGMAGERSAGSGQWASVHDIFDMASIAKPVAATVIESLAEKGVVRWDLTIGETFPELRDSIRTEYLDVTLGMLARHRSGLEQWMSTNERWVAWNGDHAGQSATEKRLLFAGKVLRDAPRHTPDTEYSYSNDGYLVLGAMIERISGRVWEDIVREALFTPLDLKSMRFGVPPFGSELQVAWGHEDGFKGRTRPIRPDPEEYGEPPFGSPSGFLYSSIVDMLRFVDFQIRGANGESELLSRDGFGRLQASPDGQRSALGWEVEVQEDGEGRVVERSIFHGGYSGRFRTNVWFSPESQTGTVIVYNTGSSESVDAYVDIFYALLEEIGTWELENSETAYSR